MHRKQADSRQAHVRHLASCSVFGFWDSRQMTRNKVRTDDSIALLGIQVLLAQLLEFCFHSHSS
ncbi:MAG: hypothetical protein Q8P67_28975 [archaeon]|nr:hypothetical protein [archaeon]